MLNMSISASSMYAILVKVKLQYINRYKVDNIIRKVILIYNADIYPVNKYG